MGPNGQILGETSNVQGGELKRMKKDVSNRICTAQVVVCLSGAVRQLVDNSIDAGATEINIQAVNNGFDSIEVRDDGHGIDAENFPYLCKPHATSKLDDISGFDDLTTLGFRGEALNALCSLGTVSITTRSAASLLATKLVFDQNGEIIQQSNTARQVGTTVMVEKLFARLPVRRKELEKTSKREFNRVLSTIQCFAFSRPDIRFVCGNNIAGKRQQLICTPGKCTVKEVVMNLFGRSDKNKMMELKRDLPDEEICSFYNIDPAVIDEYKDFQFSGFVSSCEHGYGRSSTDRQFIYVNQRPVDYPKVCRVINEVYQQYNRSQYPTIVLFITVPPNKVDVNVTPDKRTVLIEGEKYMFAVLKATIQATFLPLMGSLKDTKTNSDAPSILGSPSGSSNSVLSSNGSPDLSYCSRSSIGSSSSPAVGNVFDMLKNLPRTKRPMASVASAAKRARSDIDSSSIKPLTSFSFTKSSPSVTSPPARQQDLSIQSHSLNTSSGDGALNLNASGLTVPSSRAPATVSHSSCSGEPSTSTLTGISERKPFTPPFLQNISRGFEKQSRQDDIILEKVEQEIQSSETESVVEKSDDSDSLNSSSSMSLSQVPTFLSQMDEEGRFLRPRQQIKFSVKSYRERMNTITSRRAAKTEPISQTVNIQFSSTLEDDSTTVENELKDRLKKTHLEEMVIVGQFNNGFIISRLQNELFIIDQHASDEKYNFERLQRKATVDTQKLLAPRKLDFGVVQEAIIRDNLTIFQKNGFGLEFLDDEEGNSRAFLVAVPVLKSWQFDKSDIDEILSVVRDFPGEMYRPAKLRKIFASRACRSSIMVGTALSRRKMLEVIRHLATLDQPWNCPHGRPTLRHLASI